MIGGTVGLRLVGRSENKDIFPSAHSVEGYSSLQSSFNFWFNVLSGEWTKPSIFRIKL